MKRYAILSGNRVDNIAVWDGVTEWNPDKPIVELNQTESCNIGWIYNQTSNPRFAPQEIE